MAASLDISAVCEENIACQDALATIKCLECGTVQCHACDKLLHMGKLASHKRTVIYSQPLCERECSKSATIKCDECGLKLCDECNKLLHQGKKRSSHVTVRLDLATKETVTDKKAMQEATLVEELKEECDQKESEVEKEAVPSSFLLVNDKEEMMVRVHLLYMFYL